MADIELEMSLQQIIIVGGNIKCKIISLAHHTLKI